MQLQPVAFENSNEPQLKIRSFPVKSGPGPVFFRSIGLDFKTLYLMENEIRMKQALQELQGLYNISLETVTTLAQGDAG